MLKNLHLNRCGASLFVELYGPHSVHGVSIAGVAICDEPWASSEGKEASACQAIREWEGCDAWVYLVARETMATCRMKKKQDE